MHHSSPPTLHTARQHDEAGSPADASFALTGESARRPGDHGHQPPFTAACSQATIIAATDAVVGQDYPLAAALTTDCLRHSDPQHTPIRDLTDAVRLYTVAAHHLSPDGANAAPLPLSTALPITTLLIAHHRDAREAAHALLWFYLQRLDPATAPPDADLVDAANLLVELADTDTGRDGVRFGWAHYAYRASRALALPDTRQRACAMTAWAELLIETGRITEAIGVRRELVTLAANLDTLICVRDDLAHVLHTGGYCDEALTLATYNQRTLRRHHRDNTDAIHALAARLEQMRAVCHRQQLPPGTAPVGTCTSHPSPVAAQPAASAQ